MRAMTLLETVMALSLLSIIAIAGSQAVRATWQVWDVQDSRSDTFANLNGLLTHLTRQIRATDHILDVSDPTDISGYLQVVLSDSSIVKWAHDSVDLVVRFGTDPPTELLATRIDTLTFECFELDGVTSTTAPSEIALVRATGAVTFPGQATPLTLSSAVWIRKPQDPLAADSSDFYPTSWTDNGGWHNAKDLVKPPDGKAGDGQAGDQVVLSGFDTTGYSCLLPTVLVGLYMKTDKKMEEDFLDVQIRWPSSATSGPLHTYGHDALVRFDSKKYQWLWVDVTEDLTTWSYGHVGDSQVEITYRIGAAGDGPEDEPGPKGNKVKIDSVKIRTFLTAALTQTFWVTAEGTATNEWLDPLEALASPDGIYAVSDFDSGELQSYAYLAPSSDVGAILSVRLLIDYYVEPAFQDDHLHIRLGKAGKGDKDGYQEKMSKDVLNLHVGEANLGREYLDYSNHEIWTWSSISSREARFKAHRKGGADGEMFVDALALEVRYVPNREAIISGWEEQ